MAEPVLTKADFVRRYAAGNEFGNHSPTWSRVEDFLAEPPLHDGQKYHLRNRVTGGPTWYNIDEDAVAFAFYALLHEGIRSEDLYLSAMAPTELTLIQGEVMRSPWGLYLYYSQVAKPMREALAERAQSVSGLTAMMLLKRYMCQRSYEWLEYLLEEYDGHVIEFSSYGKCWGTLPGMNTVWWEIRKY
ncbi:hypothetical protein M0R72_10665 [Candidatus Pacearchaeota archaeon]|jgi:hypothetical protein|nr:hypothetical protein [Candidatus Pacearchaeota archaeon]